jgi:hypothetical protein
VAVAAVLSGNGNEGEHDDCEGKRKVKAYHGLIVAKNSVLSRLAKITQPSGDRTAVDCNNPTILNNVKKSGMAYSIFDILFSRGNNERETERTICSRSGKEYYFPAFEIKPESRYQGMRRSSHR